MTESMETLPTELLYNIFFYLPAKELLKCRQICNRWKLIIDEMSSSDPLWANFCSRDYNEYFWPARKKSRRDVSWFNLYKSLSLWPKLKYAEEELDEFASASRLSEEVRSVEVHENGIVAVHVKGGIEYYNGKNFKRGIRGSITGDYARYTENEHVIAIQNYHLHLFIVIKCASAPTNNPHYTFDNVKMFLLTDTELFFVKLNDEIYICNVCKSPMVPKFIKRTEDLDGVMSLGFNNSCLNVLTYQRNIYTLENKQEMVYKQTLDSEPNLLNILHKYNFLEQLDWRVYFQWMYVLNHSVPQGPMRDIIIIRPYGDVFFVGSNFGVLCIFHAPYLNGELDIFNTDPVRQINFMERSDIPVLATCPILQIDVLEIVNGHIVYVAMPKKVAMIKFTHSFASAACWVKLPYENVQNLNI